MEKHIPNLPNWFFAWSWSILLAYLAIRAWGDTDWRRAKRGIALLGAVTLWLLPFALLAPVALLIFPSLPMLQAALFGVGCCLLTVWYYDRVLKP